MIPIDCACESNTLEMFKFIFDLELDVYKSSADRVYDLLNTICIGNSFKQLKYVC